MVRTLDSMGATLALRGFDMVSGYWQQVAERVGAYGKDKRLIWWDARLVAEEGRERGERFDGRIGRLDEHMCVCVCVCVRVEHLTRHFLFESHIQHATNIVAELMIMVM